MALLKGVVRRLGRQATLEIVEGGDHSFRLPKSEASSQQDVYAHILTRTLRWLGL
jgi:hypothetical protein